MVRPIQLANTAILDGQVDGFPAELLDAGVQALHGVDQCQLVHLMQTFDRRSEFETTVSHQIPAAGEVTWLSFERIFPRFQGPQCRGLARPVDRSC